MINGSNLSATVPPSQPRIAAEAHLGRASFGERVGRRASASAFRLHDVLDSFANECLYTTMPEPKDFREAEDLTSEDAENAMPKKEKGDASPVDVQLQGTKDAAEGALDPVRARRAQKLTELSAEREAKKLSPHDFDLNFIFQLNEAGLPLTRKDLETLGCLDFIHVSGERMLIEPESLDPDDVFVLYPHEVGDEAQDA